MRTHRHHHRPRPAVRRAVGRTGRLGVVALATVAVLAACSNDPVTSPGKRAPLDVQFVASLQPFDSCDGFLAEVKREASEAVGPYGLNGGPVYMEDMARSSTAGADSAPVTSAAPLPSAEAAGASDDLAATGGDGSTGTNNQEAGVDEADLVKTDGTRVVTVTGGQLVVVELRDGSPFLAGRVQIGNGSFYGDKLFLLPDRAYVLGGDENGAAIAEVALSAEGVPTVTGTRSIDGALLDGRMTGTTVRLVLSTPGGTDLPFVYPSDGSDPEASEARAEEANRAVIEDSTLEDWIPEVRNGGDSTPLLDCSNLYHPAQPSGFSMLSILTIADGLGSLTGAGVLADGQITYASTETLYVATNSWALTPADLEEGEHTDVHAFSIDGSAPATYEASGRVEGRVLNQYSMSESADGHLRIATTTSPTWNGWCRGDVCAMPAVGVAEDTASESPVSSDEVGTSAVAEEPVNDSQVVVLGRDGRELREVGRVDGLGAGEEIKSVRFTGDTAYVVTFRQTDPLYVLDLSRPSAPKKLGELKVPGFSSYLHPVGENLVLGVGSDATDEGRITGSKISLYDTSDPMAPREITNLVDPGRSFMVDYDPHAFAWDAERSTAYLPFSSTCWAPGARCMVQQNGVLVLKVEPGGLTEVGVIDHSDRTPSVPVDPNTTTTTTTPATTTTVPEETTTTAPDTTVPPTTAPDVTDTTIPATTVVAREGGGDTGTSSSSGGASRSPAPSPVPLPEPLPIDPGIGCDPAFCDPGPVDPFPGEMIYPPTITRAFVVGDRIISLSEVGIAAHDVTTLRPVGFVSF